MKKALVRDGWGCRPMLAVLNRYGIGERDQYGRGKWIGNHELPRILACMLVDPTMIRMGAASDNICVQGTNIHNHVTFYEFRDLFSG